MKKTLELLAPARNIDIGIDAIKHGADAVYIGASSHGARVNASNSLEDIDKLVGFSHKFNAKVYVTLNTLIYDNELIKVENLIKSLYRIGVDAIIIQDLGILEMDIPPIALHASTQCDIRDVSKAKFLESLGFSQIVLARELSLNEIKTINRAVNVPLEAFIHGSLCVSYSGCCNAGFLASGRSGNRGDCPQICRLPFNLVDCNNNVLIKNKHLLSLKDMNRTSALKEMIDAGISSFKIEGRLKDKSYVISTVSHYREALDKIIADSDGVWKRSSDGYTVSSFKPDLTKIFNRGFTPYFLKPDDLKVSSIDSPKHIGEKIGNITNIADRSVTVNLVHGIKLNNGDGLGYFDNEGNFKGFRINKIDGNKIELSKSTQLFLKKGTVLYRNLDYKWEQLIDKTIAYRLVDIDMQLRTVYDKKRLILDISDKYGYGASVEVNLGEPLKKAENPQLVKRLETFSKLGDTHWRLDNYKDLIPELFVPVSILTKLKRDALTYLEKDRLIRYKYDIRKPIEWDKAREEVLQLKCIENVSNRNVIKLLNKLHSHNYRAALEIQTRNTKPLKVMESKYCIRRELGACLKTLSANKFPEELYLLNQKGLKYRLKFDCRNCKMLLYQI